MHHHLIPDHFPNHIACSSCVCCVSLDWFFFYNFLFSMLYNFLLKTEWNIWNNSVIFFHISGSFEVKPYCLSVAAYLLCPELDFSLCTHTHTSPGSMCLNSFFEWEHHSYWLGVHVVPSFYLIDIFKGPISKISKRQ